MERKKSSKHQEVTQVAARLSSGSVLVTSVNGTVVEVRLGTKPTGAKPDPRLARRIEDALRRGSGTAGVKYSLEGLPEFSRRVLLACAKIPAGEVRTYAELARAAGRPKAARAVGQVMAMNPVPLVVPCHRVVGSNRSLTGFGGGMAWKEALLAAEGWEFEGKGRSRRLADRTKAEVRS
jgi:methylated-DNA-[protein]-cysteine S-methyltransferase